MKLRQIPEDFVVDEIPSYSLKESGKFRVYLLEKRGLETLKVIEYLSKEFEIQNNEIGYAGLKDTHAISRQYISISTNFHPKELTEPNLSFSFKGYLDKNIELGDLIGNRFKITVRDLVKGEIEGIYKQAKRVIVPNYYDSQRFGSFLDEQFIAKEILKKNYENAVKLFLTVVRKSDSPLIKADKRLIKENWPNFVGLSLQNGQFRKIVEEFIRTKDWQKTYHAIPPYLRDLFMNAYLSYLWNESVKAVILKVIKKKFRTEVPYALGKLIFFKGLSVNAKAMLPERFILDQNEITQEILKQEGISYEDLCDLNIQERELLIGPQDFVISQPLSDELNSNETHPRFKIQVEFTLTKGSYATLITKHLFRQ